MFFLYSSIHYCAMYADGRRNGGKCVRKDARQLHFPESDNFALFSRQYFKNLNFKKER